MSLQDTARRWGRVGVVAVIGLAGITTSTVADAAIIIDDDEELTRFEIDGDPIPGTHSAFDPKNEFVDGDWGTGGVFGAYGPETGVAGALAPEEYSTGGVQPLLWDKTVAEDAHDLNPGVTNELCGAVEDQWKGGSKVADIINIDDVSALTDCGELGTPKADLIRAYTAYEIVTLEDGDHTIIYGAWERDDVPGELYFYIPISDGVPGNTPGDRLIAFDYDSSSGLVSFRVLAWTGSWTAIAVDPADFQGAVGYADGAEFTSGNPSFGEFALDLTAAGVLAAPVEGACLNYTTAGYVFTETGNSAGGLEPGEGPGNAQLKDYISAEPLDLSNCAEVSITKTVNGATDWSFDFTIAPVPTDEVATKTATDESPTVGWGNIIAGQVYTITETVPAGWEGGVLTCTGGGEDTNAADNAVTFVAEAGEEIACDVTNNKLGSITVVKQTDPDLAEQSFDFTFDAAPFSLTDGQSEPFTDLPAGLYEIEELDTSGWALTDIVCDGLDVTTDVAAGTASVNLAWGENVTCTYANTQQGKVIVVKQTDPDGSPQSFGFTFGEDPFALSDGESFDSGFVAPNVPYTITENATSGWVLTSVSCDNGVTSDTNSVAVTPAPGQTVTCTFTNAERGPVTVLKSATGPVTRSGDVYTVGYTLTVSSASEVPEAFVLSDLPEFAAGTTIQSMVVNGPGVSDLDLGADGGEIISDTIAPHDELVYDVVVTFTIAATTADRDCDGADSGTFNTATVAAFGGNSSSDCVDLPDPAVTIVKSVAAGQPVEVALHSYTVTYTVTVDNTGDGPGVYSLSDTPSFGTGADVTSVTVSGSELAAPVSGDGSGPLAIITNHAITAAEAPHVYTVVVAFTVDPGITDAARTCEPGTPGSGAYNSATVTFPGGSASDDACVDIPVPPIADLAIVKTAPAGPFAPGSTFAWTLTVTNNGPAVADDVVVTDEVPSVLVVTGVTSADFECGFTGNSVTCTRPSLAVGASGTISIAVQVPANNTATSITNIGVVSASTPDPVPENNSDDATVPLVAQQVTPPPPPPAELPATGGSVASIMKGATLLIGLGAVALLLGQHRRRSVTPGGPTG